MRNDLIPGYKMPPAFCEEICRRYGVNRFGEAIWRVRSCRDRVMFIGGYWDENGRFEYKRTRRYGNQGSWILERYVPAKVFGDPRTWAGRTSNTEGYLNQGAYPVDGVYICTDMFTQPLTPTLVMRAIQSSALGDLADAWMKADVKRQEIDARERKSDESFDREWEMVDSPRRGLTYSGGKRVNEHENLVVQKATEIAAQTGGQFREAKSGFEQIDSLEALQ